MAIVFPLILLVQDHLDGRYPWPARLRRYAVLAGFVAGYLVMRTTALRGIAPVPKNDLDLSAGEGVMNAFVLLAKYLGLLVYPADLCAVHLIQPERSWLSGAVLASVGLTAALAAFGGWAIYRRRSAAVALAALVLPLLPVIYLPRLGPIFAERFLYFPSVGAALLTGLMVARSWDPPWRSQRFVLSAALAVLVIVLAGLTIDRNRDWKDEYSQSLDITAKVPSAYNQHLVVAYAQYFKLGRQEEGLRHYEAAFKVKPELRNSVPPSLNEFGVGLLRARDVPGAIRHFELAVRLSPAYALAWNNLGIAYYEQGRRDLAIEQFRKALAVDPNNRETKVNLAKLTASD